ncbi:MAG: prepilin-type N-terminal cleavage/methylation domain-containing protein [Campylobacterales bacterium]|nr:prepilin-type N-terminal cleavage/methylation domain-containing protein [Campylobacterales bacterium]
MRKAFTLIEMMVATVILVVLMLFLYKSYGSLNRSNSLLSSESQKVQKLEELKKTLFLDVTLAKKVVVQNESSQEDVLFLQTSHSLYRRFEPYVAYIVKEKKLYRLESLKEFKEYPLAADNEFVAEELTEVKSFRIYPAKNEQLHLYLIHTVLENGEEILLKTKALNKEE